MKISIITICLNRKNEIKSTIESVLSQKHRNIEYILIDGGSTDGSSKIINLDKLAKSNQIKSIKLNPYDTIKIDEKFSYLLLTRTSIIAVLLQLTNVILNASSK